MSSNTCGNKIPEALQDSSIRSRYLASGRLGKLMVIRDGTISPVLAIFRTGEFRGTTCQPSVYKPRPRNGAMLLAVQQHTKLRASDLQSLTYFAKMRPHASVQVVLVASLGALSSAKLQRTDGPQMGYDSNLKRKARRIRTRRR